MNICRLMRMAIISLQKGSGKRSRVREKSVKSQGIFIWLLSGNPGTNMFQFIHLADGRKRNPAQKEAYNKAWELLTTTDVDTLLTQHAVITQEDLKTRDVADIIVKGMLQQLTTLKLFH